MVYLMLTSRKPLGNFKNPSRLISGLDEAWDKWVARALDPDPAVRFATAQAAFFALPEEGKPRLPFGIKRSPRKLVYATAVCGVLAIYAMWVYSSQANKIPVPPPVKIARSSAPTQTTTTKTPTKTTSDLAPPPAMPPSPVANHVYPAVNSSSELDTLLSNAKAKYTGGDYDGAIADYTQAIVLDPELRNTFVDRGNAKSRKGDYDGGTADYNQAIALDPNYAIAYNNRGNNKNKKGDYDGAIADLNEAIALDPAYALAYTIRALAKQKKGDQAGADADHVHAQELNASTAAPLAGDSGVTREGRGGSRGTPFPYANLTNSGFSKLRGGDYDGAIADYTSAIALGSNSPGSYYDRGLAKRNKGDYDGAIADFTEAISHSPNYAPYYDERGTAKQMKGDSAGAKADFAKRNELNAEAASARAASPASTATAPASTSPPLSVTQKLHTITIPRVDIQVPTPLDAIVRTLHDLSVKSDPDGQGVSLLVYTPAGGE